jgi:hypothetical protein
VDVTVAWDNLASPDSAGFGAPKFKIRTPALGSSNDYSLVVMPYTSEPDPEGKKTAFSAWEKAGVPSMQVVIQGGTHYEYSRISQFPVPFPTSNWKTWGNPFANHYSLAWIDRWLKKPGETGYADADQRLLDDKAHGDRMSFYFRSARDFRDRAGVPHVCQDIRAGCTDTASAFTPPPYKPAAGAGSGDPAALPGLVASLPNSGAGLRARGLVAIAAGAALVLLAGLSAGAALSARRRQSGFRRGG